jgi:hypothetical protein
MRNRVAAPPHNGAQLCVATRIGLWIVDLANQGILIASLSDAANSTARDGRGRTEPVAGRKTRLAAVALGALAGASVCATAYAAPSDLFAGHDDFTAQPNQMGPPAPHRSLQWNTKTGRWGVNLEMAQPVDRDVQWQDARIGLNYQVVPGLRTGVGVSLGNEPLPDGRHLPDESAPRVRLQTSFKF